MAKIKKSRREVAAPVAVTANRLPLVSVIIPMYNSAKFIPQTLESLCCQTMRDFEVVVVDDCSTDNSVAVVESFAGRVGGGGMHVVKLRKNSGHPGVVRNVGINFARGKYIAFLDSDDLFTKTALEELATLAEKFQADVVRTSSWFVLWDNKKKYEDDPAFTDFAALTNPANRMMKSEVEPSRLTAPTFIADDFAERVKTFVNWKTFWTSWLSFCRRDFLVVNQIFFPPMFKSEDAPFVFKSFLLAKKLLRVPNACYIRRPRINSISKIDDSNINIPDYLHKNIAPLREGFNELERVMDEFPFFKEHPEYRYGVLEFFFQKSYSWLNPLLNIYAQVPAFKLNDLIKREFLDDDALFAAYLFNTVNIQRLQIARLQHELNALKASK